MGEEAYNRIADAYEHLEAASDDQMRRHNPEETRLRVLVGVGLAILAVAEELEQLRHEAWERVI